MQAMRMMSHFTCLQHGGPDHQKEMQVVLFRDRHQSSEYPTDQLADSDHPSFEDEWLEKGANTLDDTTLLKADTLRI